MVSPYTITITIIICPYISIHYSCHLIPTPQNPLTYSMIYISTRNNPPIMSLPLYYIHVNYSIILSYDLLNHNPIYSNTISTTTTTTLLNHITL